MPRPILFRLGMVAVVAVIGLTTATGPAGADEPTSPPPPTSSEPPPPTSSEPPPSSSSEPPSPSSSEPPPAQRRDVRLAVDATFEPDHYWTGDPLTVTVTVTNSGTDPATGLTVDENTAPTDRIVLDAPGWRALDGVTIAAGATHELVLTGRMTNPRAGFATLSGTLRDGSGTSAPFEFRTLANDRYENLGGVMYRDRDGDRVVDPGEGRGETVLSLVHADHPSVTYTEVTDAAGGFTFAGVPTGTYLLSTGSGDGWHLSDPRQVTVAVGGNDPIQVRAVRRSAALGATLAFERDSYGRDDVAGLKVRLTNKGATALTGVTVNCLADPERNHLTGTGPGWAPLTAPGVTLKPGQTRTFRVTERVPDTAFTMGFVEARCDFTDGGTAGADAADTAKVPGGVGVLWGEAFYRVDPGIPEPPTNIRPFKDIRVVAVSITVSGDRCPEYLETRTDDQGIWQFDRVPAGPYRVYAFPPEGFGLYPPHRVQVKHGESTLVTIEGWEDATTPPPPLPEPPPGCGDGPGGGGDDNTDQPNPQAKGSSGGLAYTGASVLGVAAVGALALLTGAAGVVAARRRKSPQ